ncbi:MAG: CDP-alcohol phosphatidyltransferase family protein [Lachnospiraceae bacterium]|nr:CDP-alcohol phosphatidyltransferase family protein [Lachnospiraceae bacterium]
MLNKKPLVGYYGYWVVLTYLSIISAVFGIYFAFSGSVKYAIFCLMISGLCDTFDGRVASLKKRNMRELTYGMQIDAMADLVSFGVLPAAIAYATAKADGTFGIVSALVASVYVLAALIRLSYFNAVEAEMHQKKDKRTYFEGIPTTSVTLLIPLVYSICNIFAIRFLSVYNVVLVITAIFFVLKIKIPKPSPRNQIILCVIGLPLIIYVLFTGVR